MPVWKASYETFSLTDKLTMQTVLLGLNEINFEYIKFYTNKGLLPTFDALLKNNKLVVTESENEYSLLEPWIQWVTVHSGQSYAEHQVFRLGDIVDRKDIPQIFEVLEKSGYKIGAVSPFNADNRLQNPAFFIPDPWTQTTISGSKLVQSLFEPVRKLVNENAKGTTGLSSLFSLFLGMLSVVPIARWPTYVRRVMNRKKPGSKAVILDSLLTDVFVKEWEKHKPDFATLFLNSGAHIQHHYLFNSAAYNGNFVNPQWYCDSNQDPLLEILQEYDHTLRRILNVDGVNLVVMTGLHQKPHEALTYYWRPTKHDDLIKTLGIKTAFTATPRMSRDFLIKFDDNSAAKEAETILNSYHSQDNDEAIFAVDNRGTSLFVELVYSNDISDEFTISSRLTNITVNNFKAHVAFVAIKNGEHNGDGYLVSNQQLTNEDRIPLTQVYSLLVDSVSAHKPITTA